MSRFSSDAARAGIRRRIGTVAAAAMTVAALVSCELETVTVPKTTATVVVHSVLNLNATSQVVLVERTLTGATNIPDTSFDATDPIVSGGGIPISGATVEIIDSLGRTVRGIEDRTVSTEGKGAGVYRLAMTGSSLVMGARYQLRVRTPTGEEVTGSTRIPRSGFRTTGGLTRTFNRDHDVMSVLWAAAPSARTYAVRVETPYGPFFLFTDSTNIRLTGDLRNIFAEELQRVFIPGFRQDMIVAAVDSNFYDYYRTNNDPFTGSGIISRLTGGIGLFGSLVTLNSGTVSVIADRNEPVEGRYRLASALSTGPTPTTTDMTLYIESKAARTDSPTALSGRYTATNGRVDGVIGEQLGSQVTLDLLNNQLAGNRFDTFTGTLHGDTLTGTFRRGAAGSFSVFLRTP